MANKFDHDHDSLEEFVRALAETGVYSTHDAGDVIMVYWKYEAEEWVKEITALEWSPPSAQIPRARILAEPGLDPATQNLDSTGN